MTKYLGKTTIAASLLLFAAHIVVQPACAQTDTERQDVMMVMEGAGAKRPSSMSVKDKADLTLRRIARAGQRLLVYSTPAITNDPILPWADIPANPSDLMTMRACRGEYEPASFIAYPIEDDLTIEVTATDLKGSAGTVASAKVDIRVVKCWYQAGSSEGYSMPPKYVEEVGEKDIMILENTPVDEGRRVLTPELLLKDDDLVRTEKWYRQNFVKLQYPGGTNRWLWISAPRVVFPGGRTVEPWIMSPDTVGKQEDVSVESNRPAEPSYGEGGGCGRMAE